MNIRLSPVEARVVGCLIEKQVTTPDQYPLSLNALVAACNQKNTREPVMTLAERDVRNALDALARRHLVVERSGFGSRVPKYQHRLCNTEFGTLKFDPQELALVCELLLRGAQTPGELRGRASRMASLADSAQVEALLEGLASRPDGPFVRRLAREPGRREARYAHSFAEPPADAECPTEPATSAPAPAPAVAADAAPGDDALAAIAALERRLQELEDRLARLESDGRR
jgi:uncharacterized protein YceH (UPF0502 family)